MSLRNTVVVLGILSLAFSAAGPASAASYFTDLSALTGAGSSYYSAYPTGVNSSGAVSMQGFSSAYTGAYYHSYLYTGGTAPTMNDITSTFGGVATRVLSMNASGQMSASLGAQNPGVSAFYTGGLGGTVTVLPVPPGCTVRMSAMAIDNAGEVGGVCQPSGAGLPQYAAAVYSGGAAYTLDTPPNIQQDPETLDTFPSYLTGLSPNGAYGVGNWNFYVVPNPPGTSYACVWTPKTVGSTTSWTNGGAWTDISAPIYAAIHGSAGAYTPSEALAANNSGQILCEVGGSYGQVGSTGASAVIYQMGTGAVTQLGGGFEVGPVLGVETFNQDSQLQQSINASGQVVGSEVVGGVNHAALWQNGTIIDLNTLYAGSLPSGFVLNTATAIDDQGDIGGYGTDSSSHTAQAFLLKAFLLGDANLDGEVDINDLTIVLSHYGQSTGMSWSTGDVNGDGKVDINDLTIVLAHYNQSIGSSAAGLNAVPEPSTLAMFAAALFGLLACAWRGRQGGTP